MINSLTHLDLGDAVRDLDYMKDKVLYHALA